MQAVFLTVFFLFVSELKKIIKHYEPITGLTSREQYTNYQEKSKQFYDQENGDTESFQPFLNIQTENLEISLENCKWFCTD